MKKVEQKKLKCLGKKRVLSQKELERSGYLLHAEK